MVADGKLGAGHGSGAPVLNPVGSLVAGGPPLADGSAVGGVVVGGVWPSARLVPGVASAGDVSAGYPLAMRASTSLQTW